MRPKIFNYLVTGVAGFIGSAVAKKLLDLGHRVVGVDNLSTGHLSNIPNEVDFFEIGAHQIDMINHLKKYDFNAIFHIAGQSGGELSYFNPIYDLQANTQSTLLLLEYLKKSNCKKIIYASTVSVYGEPINDLALNENNLPNPKSLYGVSKLASEHYLRIFAEQFGINSISLRLFNIYGPGQNLDNFQQGMTSIYLSQAIRNKHILVKGSKKRFRDLVFIDDAVDAFVKMLDDKYTGYHVYNVSKNKKIYVSEIVKEIQVNLPFPITIEYKGSTPGDVLGYTGNFDKLNRASNWYPNIEMNDGIKRMTNWALNKELI